MDKALYSFYNSRQDEIESLWADHISYGEWGSGEDRINITDDMFWEFVEDLKDGGSCEF